MDVFLQTLVAGVLIGGIYSLIGIGMTLIMGVMGIINLAHGQLMMVAMYITFVFPPICIWIPIFPFLWPCRPCFSWACFSRNYLLNPLMKIESILPENQVLMTVGIGMVLTEIARFIFSSDYKRQDHLQLHGLFCRRHLLQRSHVHRLSLRRWPSPRPSSGFF